MYRVYVLLLLGLVSAQGPKTKEQFRVHYEWNYVDYEWEKPEDRDEALKKSTYIPKNVLMSGLNYYKGKIFVTMPRMLNGVPATLGTIPVNSSNTAPFVTPFPSWEANEVGDCSALQFVQNIEIDKNDLMWILDNGRVGTMTMKPEQKCMPSIVLIDLKSGTTMERIPLAEDIVASGGTYLNDLVVDNRFGDYAYITDNSANDPGIIVFRRRDRKSWKVRDPASMFAVPSASIFKMNGTNLNLPVNIDGIALGPVFKVSNKFYDRMVYYCPLASTSLYAINASVLMVMESSLSQHINAVREYVKEVGLKSSQTDGMKMDNMGVLFYGLIENFTIAEWNTSIDFRHGQRTIARDGAYIQWVDRFTFDDNGQIYVMINRLHNFVAGKVDTKEVNYRLLRSGVGSRSYVFSDIPDDGEMPVIPSRSPSMTVATSVLLIGVTYLLV